MYNQKPDYRQAFIWFQYNFSYYLIILISFWLLNNMKRLYWILLLLCLSIFWATSSFASIDLNVSPIRYELEGAPGQTITQTAKLINNSSNSYTITTAASDFEADNSSGTPVFVRRSELVYPDQQLSSWISFSDAGFVIGPQTIKEITFDINIPTNATPWGHYGAIFFKNNTYDNSGNIGLKLDYGIIILLNVDGEITSTGTVAPVNISSRWRTRAHLFNDSWDTNTEETENQNNEDPVTGWEAWPDEDFNITFDIPFENNGNIHLKPTGQIVLKDEEGNELKNIWKEVITNNKWVIIGEKIVDYIPINDGGGNVLPSTKRNFTPEWRGFPYKDYDEYGNPIVKYWDPWTYYTRQNVEERWFLFPWEQVKERTQNKTITAFINVWYETHEWEDIEFNSAQDFEVSYQEKYIGLNFYVMYIWWACIGFFFLIYLILFLRKKKCKKCGKRIKRNMKVCPYCGKKQKKKK